MYNISYCFACYCNILWCLYILRFVLIQCNVNGKNFWTLHVATHISLTLTIGTLIEGYCLNTDLWPQVVMGKKDWSGCIRTARSQQISVGMIFILLNIRMSDYVIFIQQQQHKVIAVVIFVWVGYTFIPMVPEFTFGYWNQWTCMVIIGWCAKNFEHAQIPGVLCRSTFWQFSKADYQGQSQTALCRYISRLIWRQMTIQDSSSSTYFQQLIH